MLGQCGGCSMDGMVKIRFTSKPSYIPYQRWVFKQTCRLVWPGTLNVAQADVKLVRDNSSLDQ